jgi:LPXTG-site transpeptidase (sortase) family protein
MQRFFSFLIVFLLLFAITVGFLALVDSLPDTTTPTPAPAPTTVLTQNGLQIAEFPVRVVAKDINLDISVVNPTSTDVDLLDDALTQGAVHYPTSAPLGINGTVLLFGHSSYLPVIIHQYYKTFDGIQDLKDGATVSVYSQDMRYDYSVTSVNTADAAADSIALPNDAEYLTLVTCDSFTQATSSRYVVTAKFVSSAPLVNGN